MLSLLVRNVGFRESSPVVFSYLLLAEQAELVAPRKWHQKQRQLNKQLAGRAAEAAKSLAWQLNKQGSRGEHQTCGSRGHTGTVPR